MTLRLSSNSCRRRSRLPSRGCASALIMLLVAGACTGGNNAPAGSDTGSAQAGSFPVTIDHRHGSTVISEEPERVVSIGYQEHDTIFALGVAPVGVRYWYGDENDVIFPWAEEAADGADPTILNMPDGLNFEAIAALNPDLILGLYSGMTEQDYQTLSAVAPTVAQPDGFVDYGTPWQEATVTIGAVLGKGELANALVADVEGKFQAVRDSHPEWSGRTLALATYGEELGVFASQDLRARFFGSLGFKTPSEFDDLAGDLFYANFSFEQTERLEADVLVWDQVAFTPGGRSTIENNPLLQQLDATKEGRVVFIGEFEDAFAWNSVLSLPLALEGIVPMLEKALPAPAGQSPAA